MFPWGVVPIFLPPVYYFELIFKFHKIIYKAVGDTLPADASFRTKPQKGCKLLSESRAGSTKCFRSHICFFSTALGGEGRCDLGSVLGFGRVLVHFSSFFLKFALRAKARDSHAVYHVGVSKGIVARTYCKSSL